MKTTARGCNVALNSDSEEIDKKPRYSYRSLRSLSILPWHAHCAGTPARQRARNRTFHRRRQTAAMRWRLDSNAVNSHTSSTHPQNQRKPKGGVRNVLRTLPESDLNLTIFIEHIKY